MGVELGRYPSVCAPDSEKELGRAHPSLLQGISTAVHLHSHFHPLPSTP